MVVNKYLTKVAQQKERYSRPGTSKRAKASDNGLFSAKRNPARSSGKLPINQTAKKPKLNASRTPTFAKGKSAIDESVLDQIHKNQIEQRMLEECKMLEIKKGHSQTYTATKKGHIRGD